MLDADRLNTVISRNLDVLRKPGVLAARPGFKATNDWLTDKQAIVITVEHKLANPPAGEMLPSEIEGIPTDVRQASPRKRLELTHPAHYASELRVSPDVGSVPHFQDEVTMAGTKPAAAASAHAELAKIPKPELSYSGPEGVSLAEIEAKAKVTVCASPDAGWSVLDRFLSETSESLTVGLYDFTAKHIADTVTSTLTGKKLSLVLDHPPQNPTADETDADTVAGLRQVIGDSFDQAWALTRLDPDATSWIYPTAYHIKVAVRDHTAFWLSSGNWNNSNQPEIDPVTKSEDADVARSGDRDWHVVIEQPQLAEVFEKFIANDLSVAAAHNGPPEQPGSPLPPPPLPKNRTKAFAQFFAPQTFEGTMRIKPLLTPDPGVYANAIERFIASARETLYMQFQYIELPKAVNDISKPFVDLVNAVLARQAAGVDVRIIMSEYETKGYLEQLKAAGLNTDNCARIQNNVHNKGVIVDGRAVLVSSQNWSTDGTLYNRDAGVILHNEHAAQYFQQIFLHDWEHLAHKKALDD